MTPEDAVKNQIMLKAGELGLICLRLNSGRAWNGKVISTPKGVVVTEARPIALCPEGTSDLLVILKDGRCCFVECKAGKGKPTDAQLRFIQRVRDSGGVAGVCWSVQDFLKLL
jgi:hypothetical protein